MTEEEWNSEDLQTLNDVAKQLKKRRALENEIEKLIPDLEEGNRIAPHTKNTNELRDRFLSLMKEKDSLRITV